MLIVRPLVAAAVVIAVLSAACRSDGGTPADPTPSLSATPAATRIPAPTVMPSPVPSPTPAAPAIEPIGFPLDPTMRTDVVVGVPGARAIQRAGGVSVREVSEQLQPSDDPVPANASGWNCRVHAEYEGGIPAVDWYVPAGTPVYATMDGAATLWFNTFANGFEFYGVDREPYIGNPDRPRAPIAVFPGPGGGMGLYVSIENGAFRSEYGHLDPRPTIPAVPSNAFIAPYDAAYDYATEFAAPRPNSATVAIASWQVRRGDVIGFTGDTGYSEAPHLHYQITRLSDGRALCPTAEAGVADGGWLLR